MSWASGRVRIPKILFLVVLGFSETAAIFSPTRAFIKVDFPTFGLPTTVINPDLKGLLLFI